MKLYLTVCERATSRGRRRRADAVTEGETGVGVGGLHGTCEPRSNAGSE